MSNMSNILPHESMPGDVYFRKKKLDRDDILVIVNDQTKSENVAQKKHRRKYNKSLKDMWENEQFIQIKGIQKTQEAVNRNLRQLQLEKMRITRNKRIEETAENIRRRRETRQQKIILKEVLQKIKGKNEQLHDEENLNEDYNTESNKENRLSSDNTPQGKLSDWNSYNRTNNYQGQSKEVLPPLIRTTRRRPYLPMASLRNSAVSSSSFGDAIASTNTNGKEEVKINTSSGVNKRSIVITIPDVNMDASFIQRSSQRKSHSADSSKRSDKSVNTVDSIKHHTDEKILDGYKVEMDHPSSAKSRLKDLPPIKFTLQGFNGPPVSYYIEKGNMISYRPIYGVPTSKLSEDRSLNPPAMMVSPRNSSISIPLVRKDVPGFKNNLSIVGKNLQLPLDLFPEDNVPQHVGRVSSYDIRSSDSADSSTGSSKTPPRHSMRGSKISKKKNKDTTKKEPEYTTSTGFFISEFAMQERKPKKQIVRMEKQPLHEFPVHVRERYIKKKLLMAQTDMQDAISWKVRKYITDPGSFSTSMSRDLLSPVEVQSEISYRKATDSYVSSVPPNKKDISDLLLRMLLKQTPRNKVQRERTVPSEERISAVLEHKSSIPNKKMESKEGGT